MFITKFAFLFFISQVFSKDCESVKCPKVPKHYEELDCVPIFEPEGCCPKKYSCEKFFSTEVTAIGKCSHKGILYEPRASIPTDDSCMNCRCHGHVSEPGSVTCSSVDCFGANFNEKENSNCIVRYDDSGCCHNKVVCDNDLESLSKCNFNGRTYYEGQYMEVDEPCYNCVCDKNFNENESILKSKSCKKVKCHMDLLYKEKLEKGCIPVYYKTSSCCPIEMLCPDNFGPYIFSSNNTGTVERENFCAFRDYKVPVGDSFLVTRSAITCKCEIPPLLTCTSN